MNLRKVSGLLQENHIKGRWRCWTSYHYSLMILGNLTQTAASVMTFAMTAVTLLWNCLNMLYCSRKKKKKKSPRTETITMMQCRHSQSLAANQNPSKVPGKWSSTRHAAARWTLTLPLEMFSLFFHFLSCRVNLMHSKKKNHVSSVRILSLHRYNQRKERKEKLNIISFSMGLMVWLHNSTVHSWAVYVANYHLQYQKPEIQKKVHGIRAFRRIHQHSTLRAGPSILYRHRWDGWTRFPVGGAAKRSEITPDRDFWNLRKSLHGPQREQSTSKSPWSKLQNLFSGHEKGIYRFWLGSGPA